MKKDFYTSFIAPTISIIVVGLLSHFVFEYSLNLFALFYLFKIYDKLKHY